MSSRKFAQSQIKEKQENIDSNKSERRSECLAAAAVGSEVEGGAVVEV